MRKPKENDQYVKAVEYSHALEKLLIMERENSAALRSELESTERERDELRVLTEQDGRVITNLNEVVNGLYDRIHKVESELARRDAAAGEPDGYIFCHPSGKNFWSVSHDDTAGHNGVKPFYFAAPPAVVPDIEPFIEGALKLHGLRTAADGHSQLSDGFRSGARWAARELGAQPQKVVELPMPFDVEINLTRTSGDIEYQYHESGENFDRDEILAALDAAGVKWEMKK